jgi:hypothetical protein
VDASAYALAHGVRRTRATLVAWRRQPWPVLRAWLVGSCAVAWVLLAAIWSIAAIVPGNAGGIDLYQPPLVPGHRSDVTRILGHNLLLHAMACVAGFIAGSSLPLQAGQHSGFVRWVHERGRRFALVFVVGATSFSLIVQAYSIGTSVASVSAALHAAPGLLLLALLPHALPELVALFLPLAAWLIASRRNQWDQLLAATLVTVALAVPILLITATWEVYLAPRVIGAVL